MPKKTAIRTPREIFKNESFDRRSSSEFIADDSEEIRRMRRMRLPVTAPSGAIRTRVTIATLGQADSKATMRTAR